MKTEDTSEIKRKEFTYRGKTLEELKKLDVREFSKYIKSGERRTALRQFQKIEDFISRAKVKINKNKPVRTHERSLVIVPEMVGMRVDIHDGRKFIPVSITGEMLGHRFGEFAMTRGRVKHSKAGIGATKGSKFKAKK
ncbi:MAG TPA: ribosomal protein S19 family protein [Candidatus Nanoarchaeia archaeon]|uniref:Small ribosomal subunit protein uS19 n=1 Tax=uncultured archaeon Rifle_16ft_4_minimus_37913 TaxID=1665152 RepID=A0A0H4T9W5_9ARCH|nr:ribosomal protein S19 [uncultured archaeon]AKQ03272.1 30S ribosomal protein S19, small subunit ribosomal protein S19 [uncultured archaeon Rifle_16ft_4_minimus_37913]HKZ34210.1 ribosomal protein S19 family protein [Candidatus Nanoarchaeia archaeon]